MIIETDIGLTSQDPTHAFIDTGVTVTVTHKEVAPGSRPTTTCSECFGPL